MFTPFTVNGLKMRRCITQATLPRGSLPLWPAGDRWRGSAMPLAYGASLTRGPLRVTAGAQIL